MKNEREAMDISNIMNHNKNNKWFINWDTFRQNSLKCLTVCQSTPSSSTNNLMSSGTAKAGCVSLSWMATLSGNLLKSVLTTSLDPNLECLNLLMTSCKVAEHKKYSCFNLSSLPKEKDIYMFIIV